MRTMTPKIKELTCQTCKGTGFPVVAQPVRPDRKIYPVKCGDCGGKGKIADANWGGPLVTLRRQPLAHAHGGGFCLLSPP
jgi:RNase P subunit RPR2